MVNRIWRPLTAALLVPLCWATVVAAEISVANLKIESLVDPLGIDAGRPRLSWTLISDQRGQRQTAYRVLVAGSLQLLEQNQGDLWDSGRVDSDRSIQLEYAGRALESNRQYFWKVKAWDADGNGSDWSACATWSMGLLRPEDWQARWIGAPRSQAEPLAKARNQHVRKPQNSLPLLRKEFVVRRPVSRAMVYACGLGHHQLELNGRKVGDRFLDPPWSVYEKTAYYTTDDVTDLLRPGENAFGVMLGKGFYNTEGDRRIHGVSTDGPLKFILQAVLEYDDGSRETIVSDPTWRWDRGPITHSAIQSGGDYDARLLPAGWSAAGFDDSAWSRAVPIEGTAELVAATSPPLKAFEQFKSIKIDEPEPGVFVYDFGQNASAVPRLRVQGQAGQVIRLTAAEQRHGQSPRTNDGRGRVNPAGVGHQYWEYTLRGGEEETWTPPFTYAGFQYLELTGAIPLGYPNPNGLPVVSELMSIHVRNASPTVGAFECSNALLNKTERIIDWAVRSNLSHVLTDCPHREKLGWLEVSYLMGPSIAARYDIAAFYGKVTRDIRDSQGPEGEIYTVAPNYPSFSGGFRYSPCWGAAGVMVPWLLYEQYADRRTLEENYPAMRRFVDYLEKTSADLIARPGLGDWYDYGHGGSMGASRFTPPEQTGTAIFHDCARVVAGTARLLDKDSDAAAYSQLADRIKRKFNATYFNGIDEYQNLGSPQTANAMALETGLVDPARGRDVVGRIVADIRARGNQQTSGDVGFTYLVRALARHGHSDVLFDVANRRDIGSYGFIIDRGWTSMPEAWDAGTSASMNHCMLGHIQQWFYHHLAGIQCDPTGPGFKRIIIRPQVVGDLTWVKSHHDSPHGRIAIGWQREAERLTLDVTIPVNTTATVYVPTTDAQSVTESGTPASQAERVKFLRHEPGAAVFEVLSGNYRFVTPM